MLLALPLLLPHKNSSRSCVVRTRMSDPHTRMPLNKQDTSALPHDKQDASRLPYHRIATIAVGGEFACSHFR